jgi:hypothetical protein
MIATTGAENLESLMKAQLSQTVFAESSINGSVDIITTPTTVDGTPCPTKKRKSKGSTSSTKEKTDKAILCFLLNDNDEQSRITTLSPSATTTAVSSSRDDYIREKKQIAVRADDVAMSRDISDVVDCSLQKWKVCLRELQDMEKDGISVDHPLFLATKATAKLHEASFSASLATATKAQATIAVLDTPNAVHVPFVSTMNTVGASSDNDVDENDEQQLLCTSTKSCGSSTSTISV